MTDIKLHRWSTVSEITKALGQLMRYIRDTPDDDRIETTMFGFEVRAWRTKVNGKIKLHIGYKNPWEWRYTESRVDKMAEMFMQHRGMA